MSTKNEGVAKILKLVLAVVFIAGAVFALIEAISAIQSMGATGFDSMSETAQKSIKASMLMSLAIFITLLGAAIALMLSFLGMGKIGGFVLLGAGIVALVLFVVAFVFAADRLNTLKDEVDALDNALTRDTAFYYSAKLAYYKELFSGIISIIAFAIYPIIKGMKKAFFSK